MAVAPFGDSSDFMERWMKQHKDERMPENFFIDMFAAFMKAGQFMVDRNLVHNDIKASNICFIDNDDYVDDSVDDSFAKWPVKPIVIDFGCKSSAPTVALHTKLFRSRA
jgi:serine/threonine protein kinase